MTLLQEPVPATRAEKFPLAVEIEINHDCNRTCSYCPNAKHERPEKGRMETSLFLLLMRQLAELGFKGRISYHFYNEPLLSEDLEDFVRLTRQHLPACRVDLFTNGTLLNGTRLHGLLKAGVDKFSVTRHIGADISALQSALPTLPEEDRAKVRITSHKDLPFSNRSGLVTAGPRDLRPPLKLACLIPSCVIVVTREGNVVPCYEDYFQNNSMGNIKEQPIGEIWNSARFRHFRRQLKEGRRAEFEGCRQCNNTLVIT